MDYVTYSHRNSEAILTFVDDIKNEIQGIMSKLTFDEIVERYNLDNEQLRFDGKKAKVGMQTSLKNIFKEAFMSHEWVPNCIVIEDNNNAVALDFYKNNVGAAITFNHRTYIGNDLLCFQAASEIKKVINLGLYICCTKEFSKKISLTESSIMTNFEMIKWNLESFKSIITVPVWVIGIVG